MTHINLERLNQQTILKGKYNAMDYQTRTPLYTNRVQQFNTPYVKTNQFDVNSIFSINQENTQHLLYDNVVCGRPETDDKYRFNYAIDKYITKAFVDVSGQSIINNELRVQPNKYTTPSVNHQRVATLEHDFRKYYSNDISKIKHRTYYALRNKEINNFQKDTSLFTPKSSTTLYSY